MSKSEEKMKNIATALGQVNLQTEISRSALETDKEVSIKAIETNIEQSKDYTKIIENEQQFLIEDSKRTDITAEERIANKARLKELEENKRIESAETKNSNERIASDVREHSEEVVNNHGKLIILGLAVAAGGYYALATKFNLPKPKISFPKLK